MPGPGRIADLVSKTSPAFLLKSLVIIRRVERASSHLPSNYLDSFWHSQALSSSSQVQCKNIPLSHFGQWRRLLGFLIVCGYQGQGQVAGPAVRKAGEATILSSALHARNGACRSRETGWSPGGILDPGAGGPSVQPPRGPCESCSSSAAS